MICEITSAQRIIIRVLEVVLIRRKTPSKASKKTVQPEKIERRTTLDSQLTKFPKSNLEVGFTAGNYCLRCNGSNNRSMEGLPKLGAAPRGIFMSKLQSRDNKWGG